jgi:hypothetical protein
MEMNTDKLIDKIIPPSDYQHRNGFSNTQIIDQLSEQEKTLVEDALINMLMTKTNDTLIVETLAYLKSVKSLPLLYEFLKNCSDIMARIIVSTSIFEINKDDNMINTAVVSFKELDNNKDAYYVYKIISAFYYLIKFKSPEVTDIIEKYVTHKAHLVSYNAKQALGMQ